ncbi:MAG: slipin family protein [Rhodospirillaceae bacterium]|nr:slipin family protein [Rhodospirillaceae bacterium]
MALPLFPHNANQPANVLAGITLVLAGGVAWLGYSRPEPLFYGLAALVVVIALLIPRALMIADQWEKAVVLRLGRLKGIRGPGYFLIIPFVDQIPIRIDQRIQTSDFFAEQALTKDTVPVNVDAIVFWQVHDVEKAALEIADYAGAIARVSQTTLREMIGASALTTLMSERRKLDDRLKEEIGRKIAEWGVAVMSVEIRDVTIPAGLQNAMSMQAQAEREKAARLILGDAEKEVAQMFLEAATTYGQNPAAIQLRAMNIIYETTKDRGATVLIPTAMVDSLNPGGILGLVQAAGAKT